MLEPTGSPPDPPDAVDLDESSRSFRGPPHRPTPDRSVGARITSWLDWFGVVRLVATAAGVVAVGFAVFWLVRAPAPPAEATLPMATDPPAADASGLAGPDATAPSIGAVTPRDAPPDDDRSIDEPIVVHVAGNVVAPGIYRLDRARRVHDAIELAGGGTAEADLDAVNLAQELLDGQRLYVPAVGEIAAGTVDLITPPAAVVPDGDGTPPGPVDVNRATADELDTLPGVGPSTAQAIVDERERNGPFANVDDLERVPGIGPTKLERLRGLVVV